MELKDIFLQIIHEQLDDETPLPYDENGENDENDENGENDEIPTNIDIKTEPEVNQDIIPQKPKKLSATQVLKLKWKEENPGLTEQGMNDAITFFNRRKNGIIEYKTPGTINPITGRRHVNLPEIAALANTFPEMRNILSDHGKVRDIQNYTWEQMDFYMDRVSTQQSGVELEIKIEGDTPELQKASAYKIWENDRNKIINDNNLVVIKVESKPQSIALGYLQHILNQEETERHLKETGTRSYNLNNNWCITHGSNEGNNLYYDYRNRRSYYFIMDKNRDESDLYFLSVLQPIRPGYRNSEYPYVITLRNNKSDRTALEWRDVVNVWPALEGKQHLIRYFDLLPKEITDISVDQINFVEHTSERPNPYDFAIQDIKMQTKYIDSNRYINNTRCFDVLPLTLKKTYIAKTKLEGGDYKKRFRCDNPSDPLGMLNLIYDSPGGLYKFLDEDILKQRLKIVSGVHGLKVGIVGIEFKVLYSTLDEKFTLYQQRQNNLIGVMNMETLSMVKPMEYTHSITQLVMDSEKRKPYYMFRYVERHPGNDYFYFFMSPESLTGDRKSQSYMKGVYLNKDDGDELFRTGKLKMLKGY